MSDRSSAMSTFSRQRLSTHMSLLLFYCRGLWDTSSDQHWSAATLLDRTVAEHTRRVASVVERVAYAVHSPKSVGVNSCMRDAGRRLRAACEVGDSSETLFEIVHFLRNWFIKYKPANIFQSKVMTRCKIGKTLTSKVFQLNNFWVLYFLSNFYTFEILNYV